MALARLCLNRALAAGRAQALARPAFAAAPATDSKLLRSLLSTSSAADSAASAEAKRREIAVSEPERSAAAPARRRRSGRWAWRDLREFTPFRLVDGLGSALSQVAETLSRPLERLAPSSRLASGKVREEEARYRLRFEVPGLGRDDVRVAVEDGVLVIDGEKREHGEEEVDGGGEWWCASGYHASLLLPDDARADGITAEVRDGVLYVTVPRTGERRRNVTEVKVQ